MFRNLLRPVLAAVAALAASACSYGSMVDIAPMNLRISKPVIAAGDYCEAKGLEAPFYIVSSEDCVPVLWQKETRTYLMVDPEDAEDSLQAAVVSLGANLYAAQIETPDEKDRYQIHLIIAKGNAFALLAALEDEPLKKLAAKHTKLTFANDGSQRPYIATGSVGSIRAFLREAAMESLREMKKEDEMISVGVLDKSGVPDHPGTEQQAKDVEMVMKTAEALTPN
jgi:hypothetical protein